VVTWATFGATIAIFRSPAHSKLRVIELIAALTIAGWAQPSAARDCGGHISKVITAADEVTTTSAGFVDVPRGALGFSFTEKGCMVVRFSAETRMPGNPEAIYVQVVLDGATIARPGPVLWAASLTGMTSGAVSFEFMFPFVSPGAHTLAVQWRTEQGTQVKFVHRTLRVE
jgi:hypothetical protein